MSLRTKAWGFIGTQARSSDIQTFKALPSLVPPEPIGLLSSEEAWGLPNAGIMIADDLPPSVLPMRARATQAAVRLLLRVIPNTQQLTRWNRETATRDLTDFLGNRGKPKLDKDWATDEGWARCFVQGPCAGDLHREDDVWVVDASVLAEGELRPNFAPLGVKVALHVDAQGARPAYVVMQDGKRVRPGDPSWGYARLVASAGMHNYVATVRHVLNLHYVAAQGIAVLVHNHLPWNHPVTRLLFPHAAGTLNSNWNANRSFMGPERIGEVTYAFTWKGIQKLVPLAFKAFEWSEYDMPEVFARRGTMELIERQQYPYGEDALLLWKVIDGYVGDYLSQYYDDDADVLADTALQRALEALDPAVPKPLRAKTLAELRRIITRLIFMVGPEHKIVSGITWDYFTHPYFFPSFVREGKTPEEATPFREEAENNVMFRWAISAMAWPLLADWSYVALDGKGAGAIKRFRESLVAAGHEIDARNARRKHPFVHLHPEGLETSVAV